MSTKIYSKPNTCYTLSTDIYDENTLKQFGFIEMSSDWPGHPYIADNSGNWVINKEKAFEMLRKERDCRLSKCDYMFMSDYPISEKNFLSVSTYRQKLRDLPAQEGAPWDGGKEQTPWPVLEL